MRAVNEIWKCVSEQLGEAREGERTHRDPTEAAADPSASRSPTTP